ncbi:MAG TPA: MMPL family transporter, partial [Gaiellales bacterium]
MNDVPVTAGPVARAYAWTVVTLRWPILLGWIAAAVYVAVVVPAPAQAPDSLVALVPPHSAALRADALALHRFRVPLSSETAIVQRDPRGLSTTAVAGIYAHALRTDRRTLRSHAGLIALPVVNAAGVVPGSRETGTTAITYLATPAAMSTAERQTLVDRYQAAARDGGPSPRVTGIYPAELHEGSLVDDALPVIELATAALAALLVGLRFRSPGAPLLTLAAVGTAYTLVQQAIAQFAQKAGLDQPSLLRPLLVALVLGIVTDYVVFYLSSARTKMLGGESR